MKKAIIGLILIAGLGAGFYFFSGPAAIDKFTAKDAQKLFEVENGCQTKLTEIYGQIKVRAHLGDRHMYWISNATQPEVENCVLDQIKADGYKVTIFGWALKEKKTIFKFAW